MKKRIVSVLLIATMSVGLFSGCGKSGGNTEVKQNENSNKITLMTQDTTYGKAFDEYNISIKRRKQRDWKLKQSHARQIQMIVRQK